MEGIIQQTDHGRLNLLGSYCVMSEGFSSTKCHTVKLGWIQSVCTSEKVRMWNDTVDELSSRRWRCSLQHGIEEDRTVLYPAS